MNFGKKLSFKSAEDIKPSVAQIPSADSRSEALDIIEFYENASGDDAECAFTLSSGCLLVRIFDMGRYFFPFPYSLSEGADVITAISDTVRYAAQKAVRLHMGYTSFIRIIREYL